MNERTAAAEQAARQLFSFSSSWSHGCAVGGTVGGSLYNNIKYIFARLAPHNYFWILRRKRPTSRVAWSQCSVQSQTEARERAAQLRA